MRVTGTEVLNVGWQDGGFDQRSRCLPNPRLVDAPGLGLRSIGSNRERRPVALTEIAHRRRLPFGSGLSRLEPYEQSMGWRRELDR